MLKHLLVPFLFMSPAAFADSSSSVSSESSESSESSSDMRDDLAERRVMMNAKSMDKALNCAAYLVEKQYAGHVSVKDGLAYLERIQDRVRNSDYRYRDIYNECKKTVRMYKKQTRRFNLKSEMIDDKTASELVTSYGKSSSLAEIAKRSLNDPTAECKVSLERHTTVGAVLSLGAGYSFYKCTTNLGRRYLVFGPKLSMGVGVGVSTGVSFGGDETFRMPLNWNSVNCHSGETCSSSFVLGCGEMKENGGDVRARTGEVGVGVNCDGRGGIVFKSRLKVNNFDWLYKALGIDLYK